MLPLLTAQEIKDRLSLFNETQDWSVFDDVPPEQHVSVMYPHTVKAFDPGLMVKVTETGKIVLNELYGLLSEKASEQ